ncbi:hypothetical protein [Saccharopolyspora rosea]|uniref:hypothetical protein n=1 Tax=Saccharopolyspora rosea TaxID=524884 RepID=UPI0021D81710|nr:hypothetical protein [Saccharopolyspora rosea]
MSADNEEEDTDKRKKVDVKPSQVVGGALASVTAAFLGSQLGVAGTIVGAGLTSVVITVGGALYQRSLENAKEKALLAAAKAAVKRPRRTAALPQQPGTIARPDTARSEATGAEETRVAAAPGEEPTRQLRPASGSRMHWPGGEQVVDADATRLVDQPTALVDAEGETRKIAWQGPADDDAEHPPVRRSRRVRWAMVGATSAMAFVLAMIVITGFEGVTGRPLSGGGSGTTIGQAFHPAPQQHRKAPVSTPTTSERPRPTRESEPTRSVEPTQPSSVAPTSETPRPTAPPEQPTGTFAPQPSEQPQPATSAPRPSDVVPESGTFGPAGR